MRPERGWVAVVWWRGRLWWVGRMVLSLCTVDTAFPHVYLPPGILYRDMYARDLTGTHVEMRCLRELVQHKLPRLGAHLDALGCDMSILATGEVWAGQVWAGLCGGKAGPGGSTRACAALVEQSLPVSARGLAHSLPTSSLPPGLAWPLLADWFLCLFCTSLPTETAARVWDALLNEGTKVGGCKQSKDGTWWEDTCKVEVVLHRLTSPPSSCCSPGALMFPVVLHHPPSLPPPPPPASQVLFRVALALLKLHEPLLLAQVGRVRVCPGSPVPCVPWVPAGFRGMLVWGL